MGHPTREFRIEMANHAAALAAENRMRLLDGERGIDMRIVRGGWLLALDFLFDPGISKPSLLSAVDEPVTRRANACTEACDPPWVTFGDLAPGTRFSWMGGRWIKHRVAAGNAAMMSDQGTSDVGGYFPPGERVEPLS